MEDFPARKLSDILGTVLSPELAGKVKVWSGFAQFWPQTAGAVLAAHTRPVDVRNNQVIIEADHPGWIQLLQVSQDRILAAIQRKFPELSITGVAFRLAGDPTVPGLAPKAGQKSSDSPALEDFPEPEHTGLSEGISASIDSVQDESFKTLLSSLASTLMKNTGKGKASTAKPG